MKILLMIFSIALMAVGCSSSNKTVQKELESKSNTYNANLDPQGGYNRAIAMVEASPDFSDVQKRELSELIGDYAIKGHELKKKETQYRAILVEEELDAGKMTTLNKRVAKENLSKLDDERAVQMNKFITDFKQIAGVSAKKSESLVLQVVDIF